jgi:hypothetical protein
VTPGASSIASWPTPDEVASRRWPAGRRPPPDTGSQAEAGPPRHGAGRTTEGHRDRVLARRRVTGSEARGPGLVAGYLVPMLAVRVKSATSRRIGRADLSSGPPRAVLCTASTTRVNACRLMVGLVRGARIETRWLLPGRGRSPVPRRRSPPAWPPWR